MIRRYLALGVTGTVICLYFFYQLYMLPAGQVAPKWIIFGASISGLMGASGMFGLLISVLFKIVGKQ